MNQTHTDTRATGGGERPPGSLLPPGKAVRLHLPPALRAPRTYQTITASQRCKVILKIGDLLRLEVAGVNRRRGCCNPRLCERDRAGISHAATALMTYAVQS